MMKRTLLYTIIVIAMTGTMTLSQSTSSPQDISLLRDLLEQATERVLLLEQELELVFRQFSRTVFGFDVHTNRGLLPGWNQIFPSSS